MPQKCSQCGYVEPPPYDIGFGKKMRVMREAAGISLNELSKLVGHSSSMLGAVENGTRRARPRLVEPVMATLRARAKALAEAVADGDEK
jgi:transcriptional regulator with XRE-family HTH domain